MTTSPTAFPKKMCTSDVTRTFETDKKNRPRERRNPRETIASPQNKTVSRHSPTRASGFQRHHDTRRAKKKRETNLLTHQCRSRRDFARSALSRRIRPRDRARDPRKRAATRGLVAHTCIFSVRICVVCKASLSLSLSGTFCVFVSMRSAKSDDSNSLCERFDGLLFEAEFRRSRLKKKGSVYLRES